MIKWKLTYFSQVNKVFQIGTGHHVPFLDVDIFPILFPNQWAQQEYAKD